MNDLLWRGGPHLRILCGRARHRGAPAFPVTEEDGVKMRRWMGGLALLGVVTLTGCATKGQLREGLAAQRAELMAELESERQARVAGDERLGADLQALRGELETLSRDVNGRITVVEEGLRFALPVHFAFAETAVRDEDRPALDRFAAVVQRHYPGAVVTVEGHTDPAGSKRYNRRLSQKRADAVREYLMARGLAGEVKAVGYGEDRPVVAGAAGKAAGAELNRRVVFVIESPAGGGE